MRTFYSRHNNVVVCKIKNSLQKSPNKYLNQAKLLKYCKTPDFLRPSSPENIEDIWRGSIFGWLVSC